MRLRRARFSGKYALGALAALPAFVDCSGNEARLGASQLCPRSRVYVADYKSDAIRIYAQGRADPAPCGTITSGISGPLGISVDAGGTLYVPNVNNSTVTEYRGDMTAPSTTLSRGVRQPVDTSVGSDGTLYVSELAPNTVLEFARGATSPTRAIAIPHPEGVATDSDENLYVSYNAADGTGHVRKFKAGAATGTDVAHVGFAGDVTLTRKNVLLLADTVRSAIGVYPPGKTSPGRSIATPNDIPFNFALNQRETYLYVAASVRGQISIYAMASGAKAGTIATGIAYASGVALDPRAPYAK